MAKEGAIIVLCCTLCVALVVVLFQLAISLKQPSCELILLEPSFSQKSWSKTKPLLSRDRSLLLKIDAYLEYFNETNSRLVSAPALGRPPGVSQMIQPTFASSLNTPRDAANSLGSLAKPVASNLSTAVPLAGVVATSWQASQSNLTNQVAPVLNQSASSVGPQPANFSLLSEPLAPSAPLDSARFLHLELDSISMRRLDRSRQEYTLDFKCSSLKLVIARTRHSVAISQMSVHLNPSLRNKTSCQVSLPSTGLYMLESTSASPVHLTCTERRVFRCYALDETGLPEREPLVNLNMMALEYETTTSGSNEAKLKRTFQADSNKIKCPPAV